MRPTLLFLALAATTFAVEPEWPQFREPGGSAIADDATLPITWSATKNVAWVAEVPGNGWSSPVFAGGRVFVTPARGAIKPAQTGIFGKGLVVSYGLDGRELWRLRGMTQATPSPAAGGGLLCVGSGSQGENNRPLYAIKPGATGDISPAEGETTGPFVAWFQPRGTPYTGSPLYYRGRLYSINDGGMMQVFEAETGREVYRERIGGAGNTFSSSPIASAGRIYALNENGATFVFAAGEKYSELGKNALGEMSLATPAVAGDALFLRMQTKLYRITEAVQ